MIDPVKDVLQVADQYYVRATSSFADDRTRVLKYGKTFAVFNRFGDLEALGPVQFGIFYNDTRHLSRFTLRLNGREPMLLNSSIRDHDGFLAVDLSNVDNTVDGKIELVRGTIHLFRCKFLDEDGCHEQIRVMNYGMDAVGASVSVRFAADFADIFEVRGTVRQHHGESLPARMSRTEVVLGYRGLDNVERRTRLQFAPTPALLTESQAQFDLTLKPKEETLLNISVVCEQGGARKTVASYATAFQALRERARNGSSRECTIITSSRRFNTCLARCEADLSMLIEGNPEKNYPYAGVPWFSTVFGRDGIITALECLWLAPEIAKGVLGYLAETQATEVDSVRDAEPGKILHEMRGGEMAALHEVPFGKYYGSVDATPLYLILAGGYYARTGDLEFISGIWPNIEAALAWVRAYGDVDGDGFVEYEQKSAKGKGLSQQGWKDSYDSVFHSDGQLAEAPIALCEVQSYVYGAKRAVALLAEARGDARRCEALRGEAKTLKSKFDQAFWSEELGSYALALDGKKNACLVRASNAGHTLFTGIAGRERARRLAETLMNEQMFSGWGVRTLCAGEARYNPMSYHNGSVWPHDNALIALGLSLYGGQEHAVRILSGMYEASLHFDLRRLPELFCGFHRREDGNGPTHYPVACAPQAWASGAMYLLLRACLGMNIRAPEKTITFTNPMLPASLDELRLEGLRVGEARVDLLLKRHLQGTAVEVLKKDGELEIVKSI
ncbi:MAG: amylo-alpha-1,6-glucosidase [Candidatus Acidiferrum sp.]